MKDLVFNMRRLGLDLGPENFFILIVSCILNKINL